MNKTNELWQKIWRKIEQADEITIFRHVHPDPDAYGSQYALAMLIKQLYPAKKVACMGQKVERLAYLFENFENDSVNDDLDKTLKIIVDTANVERIDTEMPIDVSTAIKIDHHPNRDAFGEITLVLDDEPATCSILLKQFLLFEQECGVVLQTAILENLYAGIIGDTGNFSHGVGLNQSFFTAVGALFERINTKELLERFYEKTINEVKFKGKLLSMIEAKAPGFYAVTFNSDLPLEYGVSVDYATGLVNMMSEVKGAKIWGSFCEDKNLGLIRCSLRSRFYKISTIAEQHGGGGHPQASGIKVKTWAEVEAIWKDIEELLENDAK